jgi:MOSC domain-containing protein
VNQTQTSEGRIVSIWRYPLKSMLGEELNSSYVTERGLIGDRVYALVDQETGKVASAKNPRKWGTLFDFHATFIDPLQDVENIPPIRITFPDGAQIFSDQRDIDDTLSKVLGREVSHSHMNHDSQCRINFTEHVSTSRTAYPAS